MVARFKAVCGPAELRQPYAQMFVTRLLGLRKYGAWKCHRCSKKRPGRPKLPRGACGMGMDRSPKIARDRWRRDLWEELES